MQSSEIISVNLWQILISLANLVILYLIVKKFLYERVKKVLEERRRNVDTQYSDAARARTEAGELEASWNRKMEGAEAEANRIIEDATGLAAGRSERIVAEAQERAGYIMRQAEAEADLERKKAQDDMKQQIVDVSTALAEKIIGREINPDDHQHLIDQFLDEIGESDGGL